MDLGVGCVGCRPTPQRSGLKRLETTMQDVDRCIYISIHHQSTVRAGMRAVAQRFSNQFTAAGTHLRRIAGVYENDTPASFFRFADGDPDKLRPPH